MKIFVTGHRGYIGSHLVSLLKEHGHTAVGCDIGLFDGCAWSEPVAPDREIAADIRDLNPTDLEGMDCVVHLAAVSNDPMGDLDRAITLGINADGTRHVAEAARAAGVRRFIFASSCAMYGKGD